MVVEQESVPGRRAVHTDRGHHPTFHLYNTDAFTGTRLGWSAVRIADGNSERGAHVRSNSLLI